MLRGGGHWLDRLIGELRRGIRREQLPYVRRHRSQGGTYLFANGGILIDLRRGLDIDGRLRGIEAGGHEHQQCKANHDELRVTTSSERLYTPGLRGLAVPRCTWVGLGF